MSAPQDGPPGTHWADLGAYKLVVPPEPDPAIPTTLGTMMTALDELRLEDDLVRFGLWTETALKTVSRHHPRDWAIAEATGRWSPELEARVADYVPGDVCGLRASALQYSVRQIEHMVHRRDVDQEHRHRFVARRAGMGAWLYQAVPYFLPVSSVMGIAGSYPPEPDLLADLRLPFDRVAVFFAADLAVPAGLVGRDSELSQILAQADDSYRDENGGFRADRFPPQHIEAPEMALAKGDEVKLSGVVFHAKPEGGVDDLVLWLTVTPSDLNDPRRITPGWLSRANAEPLALNLAAAVAWGDWHPPPVALEVPEDPDSPAFRKQVRRGVFRRKEPTGAAVGVRVLDARRMESRVSAGEGTHASPVTHMRRGHWRRQRVGPRDDWRYEQRFIPPVIVNPGASSDQLVTVYVLPEPPPADSQPPAG